MIMDYLKDIVQHTQGLGIIELVKITATSKETLIIAMSGDRSVIVQAKTAHAVPMFKGIFGMPNLTKLNTILGIPEYAKDAIVSTSSKITNGSDYLSGLTFENKAGDFRNEYRFMSEVLVNEQLKAVVFNGVKWDVEFSPSVQNIQRFKFMSSANAEEVTFKARTENGNLKFYFGDHSSHAGSFVFAEGISGELQGISKTTKADYHWPVSVVASILNLPGDKLFKISDEGAAMIEVNSGLAIYEYILPAQQK